MKQIRGRICRPGVLIAMRKPGKNHGQAVMRDLTACSSGMIQSRRKPDQNNRRQ